MNVILNTCDLAQWFYANGVLFGLSYNHSAGRRDGQNTRTSKVLGKNRGRVVTRNTIYTLVGSPVTNSESPIQTREDLLKTLKHINLAELARSRAGKQMTL